MNDPLCSITEHVIVENSCQRLKPIEPYLTCSQYLNLLRNATSKKIMETCDKKELIYDKSIITTSLVEDFEMTCSESYQRDHS